MDYFWFTNFFRNKTFDLHKFTETNDRPKRTRKATKVYDPEDIYVPSPKPRTKRTKKDPFPYTNLPDKIRAVRNRIRTI